MVDDTSDHLHPTWFQISADSRAVEMGLASQPHAASRRA